jgi:hypothetical protein
MAFRSMFTYTEARGAQDSAIEKFGAWVTIFAPSSPIKMQGYEDLSSFTKTQARCFIDFHVKRRVFYHFNWFPENEDQVTLAYFPLTTPVAVDWFIRTATIDEVSPYGDLIFKIVKIADDGKYRSLKRTVFLNAITDKLMYDKLVLNEASVSVSSSSSMQASAL